MYNQPILVKVIHRYENGAIKALVREPIYDFATKKFINYDSGKLLKRTSNWLCKIKTNQCYKVV